MQEPNSKQKRTHRILGQRGYTLTEILVSIIIFSVIAGAAFTVLHNSSRAKTAGDQLADAQQNGRAAMNAILSDLRRAGYGIDRTTVLPIEVASEYRLTMVIDVDRDGIVEPGERITYFVDADQSQEPVASTANPYDYVLRRLLSTNADSMATPGNGLGDPVAYLVTQRTGNTATGKDVPIFSFFDDSGTDLMGAGNDPTSNVYGATVDAADLGTPGTTEPEIRRIQVRVVTETSAPKSGTSYDYRRFELGSTVRPRNFGYTLVASYTLNDAEGDGAPSDTTGGPGDTTTSPPDTTGGDILPPYEPPIRISTARVLSMDVTDLREVDSNEGSDTTVDGQEDQDIVLGTKAGASNNLSVWFNGQPDRYAGEFLYNSVPNYYGNSPYDIQALGCGDLVSTGFGEPDVVAAVRIADFQGGFQVWRNQYATWPGYVGTSYPVTAPDVFYTNPSGEGMAIATLDMERDGDIDVVLGTRTGTTSGRIEIWHNDGFGNFTFEDEEDPNGAVYSLAVLDYDADGYKDIAVGILIHNNDKAGKVVTFHNKGDGRFEQRRSYTSGGKVNALAAADLNDDGHVDLVAGTKTGNNSGKVEFWKNDGSGAGFSFSKVDEVSADGVVLSIATGPIDLANDNPDVVAGNKAHTIQAWFVDPAQTDDVLPPSESWADANAGGEVHAVAIRKVETSRANVGLDRLYDIVAGTAISATEGEIVIYLNPYVWTITTPAPTP